MWSLLSIWFVLLLGDNEFGSKHLAAYTCVCVCVTRIALTKSQNHANYLVDRDEWKKTLQVNCVLVWTDGMNQKRLSTSRSIAIRTDLSPISYISYFSISFRWLASCIAFGWLADWLADAQTFIRRSLSGVSCGFNSIFKWQMAIWIICLSMRIELTPIYFELNNFSKCLLYEHGSRIHK